MYHAELEKVYRAILDSTQEIAIYLRYHSAHLVQSVNPFGKQQTSIDLKADEIIIKHLKATGVVYACVSEEQATMNQLSEEGTFIVSYDPIDGNNVLDVNMSVASIFGIWQSREIEGSTGKDLVGAACAVYGSRTSIILFNSQSKRVEELTLLEVKNNEKWVVTQPHIVINTGKASLFSPGLRSCYDIPELLDIFKQYCCAGYSLRHSGAMGIDCYQIFLKGQGVYSKFDSLAHPSNLHLIYEILPMAFLIEKAGGKTDDGTGKSVLEVKIEGLEQRVSFIAGSVFEVDKMRELISEPGRT